MYYSKPEASDEVVAYLLVDLSFEIVDTEARECVTSNASEPKIKVKTLRKNRVMCI